LARGANSKVQYITMVPSFTFYYRHLGESYFLNTVFSKNFDVHCSLKVRDKVSHTRTK